MSVLRDAEQWFVTMVEWYYADGFLLGLGFLLLSFALMVVEIRKREYREASLSFVLFLAIGMTLPMP